ncbi:MAG: DegT/DnrJ/EryC1/StrS family aminotransferase, partial [Thermodesulfobacteriota bacterium]
WYYEMQELGFNYRITDIQCALGLTQLKKLDIFVEKRRSIAAKYDEAFKNFKYIKTPIEPETRKSAYHLYVVQIDFEKLGKSRSQVMNELREKGIGTQVHYIPVFLQPYYKEILNCNNIEDFPFSDAFYRKTLSLPLYPMMTKMEVHYVITEVKKCLEVTCV